MMQVNIENTVTLAIVKKEELQKFKRDLQEAFTAAIVETFGSNSDKPIPSEKEIGESFNSSGSIVYHILANGKKIGGAVLVIDEITQHNSLDFFFIYANEHSSGIGYKAWKAIEEKYPKTKIWETHTPYFEKRNIHFYVNKCGFKIVEYLNKHHLGAHALDDNKLPGGEDFFRFEKIMKQ
jgi:hypothetical protein